jgi:hypothetical protein
MTQPDPRLLGPQDRLLTARERVAAGIFLALALALVARAASPSWIAAGCRGIGGLTFLAAALLVEWVEGRRPRPFPLAASLGLLLAAGALGGAVSGGLESGRPGGGAIVGLLLASAWCLRYARVRRARGAAAGGSAST